MRVKKKVHAATLLIQNNSLQTINPATECAEERLRSIALHA